MFKVKTIDHLVLTVKNIDKTIAFYTAVLGMKERTFGDERVALRFGHQQIDVRQQSSERAPKEQNMKQGWADLCFTTDVSVVEFKEHIESFSIEVIDGPVKKTGALGEMNVIYLYDPDGNLIEIANYIYNI